MRICLFKICFLADQIAFCRRIVARKYPRFTFAIRNLSEFSIRNSEKQNSHIPAAFPMVAKLNRVLIFYFHAMTNREKKSPATTFSGHVAGLISQPVKSKETLMDITSASTDGQLEAHDSSTSNDIVLLCELVQFLRAWFDAFQSTIQQLDKAASSKAHDAFAEAVILARRIARQLGVTLPDFSTVEWSSSVPPAEHAAAFDL
jgi:hypothetical protein